MLHSSLQNLSVTFSYTDVQIQWSQTVTSALDGFHSCWKTDISLGKVPSICQNYNMSDFIQIELLLFFYIIQLCSEEIVNKIPKATVPTAQQRATVTVYYIQLGPKGSLHRTKQAAKWLPFLSAITDALECCQVNTEYDPFINPMTHAAGKIKGIIALLNDGRKDVFRNQRRKSILTEVNAFGAEQEVVCANEKEQWSLGYYATFPHCTHAKPWVWALWLVWQSRPQVGFSLAKPKRNWKQPHLGNKTQTRTLSNSTSIRSKL